MAGRAPQPYRPGGGPPRVSTHAPRVPGPRRYPRADLFLEISPRGRHRPHRARRHQRPHRAARASNPLRRLLTLSDQGRQQGQYVPIAFPAARLKHWGRLPTSIRTARQHELPNPARKNQGRLARLGAAGSLRPSADAPAGPPGPPVAIRHRPSEPFDSRASPGVPFLPGHGLAPSRPPQGRLRRRYAITPWLGRHGARCGKGEGTGEGVGGEET